MLLCALHMRRNCSPSSLPPYRQQMKSSILMFAESHANALDDVGFQASVFGEQVASAADVAHAVDSITVDDVNTVRRLLSIQMGHST